MAAYKPTMSYRLIYIFTIHDAQHEGYWKIGKTNFDSVNSYKQLPPNCAELNCAARDRIDQYTKTAMVEYDLQYTELARRTVTFPDGTTDTELFDDDDVHNVLYNSGFSARKFSNSNQDSEWFEVPLSVAIRAIQAVKEGRTALTAAEKSEGQISFLPQTVPAAPKKRVITLRDEQMDCVNQTLRVFRKENSMLWNCKMRFGKTVTAYALIKKAGYQKVIVVTHRPVVEDGWRNDFDLIFGEGDNRAFLKKDRFDTDSSVYDAAMDARNDANLTAYQNSGKAFVYFASMQDLRGSQRADGKFDKNNAVFDMDWDLVIYDEAHEGTQTQRGQKVQSLLEAEKNGKTPKVLQLSGTPYNLMQKYENNVYTWDYVMEQKRKREWDTLHPGDHNPYIPTSELLNQLEWTKYGKISVQTFRKEMIGGMRDARVIISGSHHKKGYKIPSKKSEIEDFLNHDISIILPMLGRLKKCRDTVKLGTCGAVDLYQADAYKELKAFIEKDMAE